MAFYTKIEIVLEKFKISYVESGGNHRPRVGLPITVVAISCGTILVLGLGGAAIALGVGR